MADTTVRTYDPAQVVFTLNGVPMSGFADGTFIKINRSGDAFEKKRGADGGVDRINKNAHDFEVEFSLKRTSPFNAILSAALAADMATNKGVGILGITDLSGASLFAAPQAWIKKDPDQEYADTLGNYTWKFDTGAATSFLGGN